MTNFIIKCLGAALRLYRVAMFTYASCAQPKARRMPCEINLCCEKRAAEKPERFVYMSASVSRNTVQPAIVLDILVLKIYTNLSVRALRRSSIFCALHSRFTLIFMFALVSSGVSLRPERNLEISDCNARTARTKLLVWGFLWYRLESRKYIPLLMAGDSMLICAVEASRSEERLN